MPLVVLDLAAVVIAAALTLVYWAAQQLFGPLLSGLAANVPLIGTALTATVLGIVAYIRSATEPWVDAGVTPAIGAIGASPVKIDHLFTQVEAVFRALAWRVNNAYQNIVSTIDATLIAPLAHQVANLGAWTNNEILALQARVTSVTSQVQAWAAGQLAALSRDLTGALQATQAAVTRQVADLTNTVTDDMAQLRAAVATDVAAVQNTVAGDVGLIQADLTALRATVYADIESALHTGETYTDGRAGQLAQEITRVSAAVAAVAATAATTAERVAADEAECLTPLCAGLKDTALAAGALTGLFEAGAIAALLAEIIHDPAGFAAEAQAVLVPVVDTAGNIIKSL